MDEQLVTLYPTLLTIGEASVFKVAGSCGMIA
ncbi:hypothetical protein GA0071314_1108 [Halomonas sp. HL-93]|nr:MAG: hypothetical protein HLUCCO06_05175 [Halomonas sp. HL-93]SBR47243.1 hypothetical protein GA0071314_1108 [Halomonas sp. HL-93]